MKTDTKRMSLNSIIICSLIVNIASISNAYAAKGGEPSKQDKELTCLLNEARCSAAIVEACAHITSWFNRASCKQGKRNNCSSDYSACKNAIKTVDGGLVKPKAVGGQDAYIAPPPKTNGPARTPARTVKSMNKSSVVPKIKPKLKPTIQPKESATKNRVEKLKK